MFPLATCFRQNTHTDNTHSTLNAQPRRHLIHQPPTLFGSRRCLVLTDSTAQVIATCFEVFQGAVTFRANGRDDATKPEYYEEVYDKVQGTASLDAPVEETPLRIARQMSSASISCSKQPWSVRAQLDFGSD